VKRGLALVLFGGQFVKAEKVNGLPRLMIIWIVFFLIVPFLGTVIGLPIILVSIVWWLLTPSRWPPCQSRSRGRKSPRRNWCQNTIAKTFLLLTGSVMPPE
jgi:hypothetical protein